jgi:hypothetical protein
LSLLERAFLTLSAFAFLVLASCATGSAPSARGGDGAFRITGEQIAGAPSVLDGIRPHVPGFIVVRSTTGCPTIQLRGGRRIESGGSPSIYIAGSPVLDTCAVDQLPVRQVRLVEVFPASQNPGAGYRASPHGTILIFLDP